MYLIVVGGGPVGSSLVRLALKDGHDVALIESDENLAKEASDKFDALVLHAHIAHGEILKEAGAEKADALVATTNDDSANLMAMFLGAEHKIETLVSVVNEPDHQKLFERLGARVLMDPDEIVAGHLYGFVQRTTMERLFSEPGGIQAFRITLGEKSPLIGKTLASAAKEKLLPRGVLLVSLTRDDERIVPSGDTVLSRRDSLTVFSQEALTESQIKVFTG